MSALDSPVARRLSRLVNGGPPQATVVETHASSADDSGPTDRRSSQHEARIAALKERLDDLMALQRQRDARTPKPSIPELPPVELPGRTVRTAGGEIHLVEAFLPPDHCHGQAPVARALDVDPKLVSAVALDPGLEKVCPKGMLFIDTETTGLSGGTGTLPFLIGLGWFDGTSLTIEQLLMRTPQDEAAALHYLTERIERATAIVSYNGKSYDWPLLSSRYVLNRMPVPKIDAHLDLLHPARRVWGPRIGGARLVHVEDHILSHRRVGDVDGSEIPGLYWSFVRGAHESILAPVLEHNAQDIIALAAILGVLVRGFEVVDSKDAPLDHLCRAKVCLRAADAPRADAFLDAAIEGEDRPVAVEALVLRAQLLRRKGASAAAELCLRRALGYAHPSEAPSIHLALSKLFEHKLKRLDRALEHAESAKTAEDAADHGRRVNRLRRRLLCSQTGAA